MGEGGQPLGDDGGCGDGGALQIIALIVQPKREVAGGFPVWQNLGHRWIGLVGQGFEHAWRGHRDARIEQHQPAGRDFDGAKLFAHAAHSAGFRSDANRNIRTKEAGFFGGRCKGVARGRHRRGECGNRPQGGGGIRRATTDSRSGGEGFVQGKGEMGLRWDQSSGAQHKIIGSCRDAGCERPGDGEAGFKRGCGG